MRILFLTTHLNTGGISSYLLSLTKGLIKENHQVFIISSGGNMEGSFKALGAEHLKLDIRTKSEIHPKLYLNLAKAGAYIREKGINIIHAQTRVTQVMGEWLRISSKIPLVSTCHGFFRPRFFRKAFPCWGQAVIAISNPVKEHLIRDFKIDPAKIFLVENGIDLSRFRPADEDQKRSLKMKFRLGNDPVVGIIARLSDVKGHDVLIRAMRTVLKSDPRTKLMIVGEGKQEAALKEIVREEGLADSVSFFPIVDQTAEILPVFDVFVMPSRQEGLGLSVMEAQAAGLPVIASNVGGLPSLIIDQKTGVLVEPEDERQLAEGIISILADKAKADRLGRAGREFILNNFSLDKMADKTLHVYRHVTKIK